ncbi:MAG: BTAD domain-containing putative transcriptional regulator [Planctomycetota bacterium]
MTSAPWTIELLGVLRLSRGEEAITRFRTQKTAGLLGYLAYHLGRPHPREVLCGLFWPELSPAAARNNLSRAVSALRRQLEPGDGSRGAVLVATRQDLALEPGAIATDVQALLQACDAGDLDAALARYRGPLLEGHFEDWVGPARALVQGRLTGAVLAGLDGVEPEQALRWLRRAVAIDPLCEAAHRELIRLTAAQGETAKAILLGDALAELLERELGVAPAPETQAVIDAAHDQAQVARPRRAPPAAPPAPAAPDPGKPPLPLQLEPLFGREQELAALREVLLGPPPRLVSLLGPGGVGKTRLGLELAGSLSEAEVGAVTFVQLEPTEDAADVDRALAQALGVEPEPPADLPRRLGAALRARPTLLVLDACEHVRGAVAARLGGLLADVPSLRCLATSRRALGLPGERSVALPPLALPEATEREPAQLAQNAAVQLFLSRARSVLPDFELTAHNAPAVAALVAKLEGIPLALCLAAGWVHVLDPARILARLADSRQLLARRGPADPRHQTLDATLAASERLLDPETVALFRSLAVFRGGFSVEAAEALGDDPLTLDRLAELRDVSLLSPAPQGERLCLLELVRGYARAQLAPERWQALSARHAAYFRGFAEEAKAALQGPDQAAALASLDAEDANLRAALTWCLEHDLETGVALASACTHGWALRGRYGEGRTWLEGFLARRPAADLKSAGARMGASALAYRQGDFAQARTHLDAAVALYTTLEEPGGLLRARSNQGMVAFAQGDLPAARDAFSELVVLARERDDRPLLAGTLHNLGVILKDLGELHAAGPAFEEAIALHDAQGNRLAATRSRRMRASLHGLQGELPAAEALARASLDEARALDAPEAIARSLLSLAQVDFLAGRAAEAQARFEEALAQVRASGDREAEGYALLGLARLALATSPTEAQAHADAAARVFEDGDRTGACRAALVSAEVALARGDRDAAATAVAAARRGPGARAPGPGPRARGATRVPCGPRPRRALPRRRPRAARAPGHTARAWS